MIGKPQASARLPVINLSEVSTLQVLKNDLKAANLCYATTCELFRGMLSELLRNSLVIIVKLQASARQVHVKLSEGSTPHAASLCKAATCKFIRGMGCRVAGSC